MGGDQEPVADEPTITTVQRSENRWEVTARQGEYRGWAIQRTEALARGKALMRLRADREGWFR
jgi:hypothetical protein